MRTGLRGRHITNRTSPYPTINLDMERLLRGFKDYACQQLQGQSRGVISSPLGVPENKSKGKQAELINPERQYGGVFQALLQSLNVYELTNFAKPIPILPPIKKGTEN